MAKGFKHGPGGASLNFDVKRYDSEDALLAAVPKENTIGIITTVPITSWIFSAMEPEGLAEGMVWIVTGDSSSMKFNALKKNGIQVYPIFAKQYVSGAWADVTAYIYQSGEWVGFAFYLFSAEKGINKGTWNKKVPSTGTFTVDATKVYLTNKEDNTNDAVVIVNAEPIDTTGKSKLIVDMSVTGNLSATSAFGLTDSATNTTYNYAVATKKLETGTLELDVSSLNGIHYFKAWLNSTGSAYTATCSITEIKVV